MTTEPDKTYRTEKLLDWERKSLTGKFSGFSFTDKSTWLTLGLIILGLCVFAFIIPFIPPRYGWGNWTPATTSDEYWYRVTIFWVAAPILILVVFAYLNIRNKIDLSLGTKRTANFKVTEVLNLGAIKILLMNGWRPFTIKARQSFFNNVAQGQIITIKRTGTFRLIDYYIRDVEKFNDEHTQRQ
jgi:cytochrome c biogenesis factor